MRVKDRSEVVEEKTVVRENAPCEERKREKLLESQAVTNPPEAPTEGRKRKD